MQERVGFIDNSARKEFFADVREASGVSSWKKLANILGLRRNMFQRYQYG